LKRLNAELVRIIRSPELKATLWDRQWIDAVGSTPEELSAVLRREKDKWAATVRAAGITPD
jgi:tripartite-type tricarboxylate transporter receptor subunit TctC